MIRVISIPDDCLDRASDNKADAKENLKVSYDFTEEQAEAIVTLQLYRLTNTDIVTLEEEHASLKEQIATLAAIIGDERTMFNLMKKELREVKKLFGNPRRGELRDTAKTIEIDTASLIVEEETFVSVTRAGYIKRTSPRSFNASTVEEVGKRTTMLIFVEPAKTTQHLLLFTNLGNAIYRPVHGWQIPGGRISGSTLVRPWPFRARRRDSFAEMWISLKEWPTLQLLNKGKSSVLNARIEPMADLSF